jgi:hypothetical protein
LSIQRIGVLSCFEGHAEALSVCKVQANFNSYFPGKECVLWSRKSGNIFIDTDTPRLTPNFKYAILKSKKKKVEDNISLRE